VRNQDIAPPEVISDCANGVLRKLVVRLKDLESQLHETKRQLAQSEASIKERERRDNE
jgi:hypothetical protein